MIDTKMNAAGRYDTPETTPYDGCGLCLVGVRRLSRKSDATHSPSKQRDKIIAAVEAVGGHIIAWADDWEVSGSTDPRTRPGFGPWLRGEQGSYDGIAGAAVDRIGRNVRDILETAYSNHEAGRVLITADHVGLWNLDDPNEENELTLKALGAQMEHRNIRTRNRDDIQNWRKDGRKRGTLSYGYIYVRRSVHGGVDYVALDEEEFEKDPGVLAVENARDLATRILSDETGLITPSSEGARLTRAGVLSPMDRRRVQYGREPKGTPWTDVAIVHILTSEASLGYLMHAGKPVIGKDGRPIQIAPPLWSPETRLALLAKLAPKPRSKRAPRGTYMLSELAFCGNCGTRLYLGGNPQKPVHTCKARSKGIVTAEECPVSPTMQVTTMDSMVREYFLSRHGHAQVMRKVFVPGTGYAEQIRELEKNQGRLKEDRNAGVYDSNADTEWYRAEYRRMSDEIRELKKLPEHAPSMQLMPTGKTVADEWNAARDDAARRELLAKFDVRVTLWPSDSRQRITITSLNPYATPGKEHGEEKEDERQVAEAT
ncbi:recombinase family protein [Streptomyces sp. NPDC051662]|uniref:recombinase family protein n=1 Tax=Streptomyces sp. NPDC051662 TaxID=3154750 RepID=UPI003412CDF0